MRELKATTVYDAYWTANSTGQGTGVQVYLKSDVDPVMAELNAQVDFLKTTHDSCGSCNRCADGMGKVLNEELDKWKKKLIEQTTLRVWAEMQLRHNKYERCLVNAKYWIAVSYHCVDDKHRQIAKKRHYKWLKLSENFKEPIIGVDKATGTDKTAVIDHREVK